MTKKRGNPDWGKPDLYTARNKGPTSFEEIVRELRLSPADYQPSTQLRHGFRRTKIRSVFHLICCVRGISSKDTCECRPRSGEHHYRQQ